MRDEGLSPNDNAAILRAVLESSPDAIICIDLQGVIVLWSPGAGVLYGYASDEVIGRPLSMLTPPSAGEGVASLVARVADGTRVEPTETQHVAKGGRVLDVKLTASPITDATGRLVGAAVLALDLAERNSLRLALTTIEAHWRAIIDSAVDGIIVIDRTGAIETFNPAAERLFGYTEAEVVGRNVNFLMPTPYREEHNAYIAGYLETGIQKIIGIGREVTGLKRDGSTFPVHLSVGEIRVGDERRFTGILHDLSTRTALEDRLREQTTLARLGEMAAVIAHEVKNPLTAVRGAIQVIGRRLPADSKDGPIVNEILTRLDALNGLIQDLLLFARTPRPRLSPVDLKTLLQLTVELLTRDPALSGVSVEVGGGAPPAVGDAELLKIVFQNLMINAAQALRGDGVIRATIEHVDGVHQIRIADNGPGIPAEVREKLFRPFFTTKARGTGLGLAIARQLVEAHGGTIAVECPSSGGTIVTLRIPSPTP